MLYIRDLWQTIVSQENSSLFSKECEKHTGFISCQEAGRKVGGGWKTVPSILWKHKSATLIKLGKTTSKYQNEKKTD